MREFFERAVHNIARHGSTDVFPYSFERHLFHDKADAVVDMLDKAHALTPGRQGFEQLQQRFAPSSERLLAPVGHLGFRWATELDPFWNAYFLGLVLAAAEPAEARRIAVTDCAVFSYRYAPDDITRTLFDLNQGWRSFMEASLANARNSRFVLICDVADFYPRVYHHRIENELRRTVAPELAERIQRVLMVISGGVSYGLPIGGPAARILAEVALNASDHLLRMHKIPFCRFVDDYHIFADSREDAYRHLLLLTEWLQKNEGLTLQKSKTRLLTASEFVESTQFLLGIDAKAHEPDELDEIDGSSDTQEVAAAFLRVKIRFDPYSQDPEGDYERMKAVVEQYDVLGLLGRELEKSRVHSALTRNLLRALRFMPNESVAAASRLLVDNLETLAPVFPLTMIALSHAVQRLGVEDSTYVKDALLQLLAQQTHVALLPLNQMYLMRTLLFLSAPDSEAMLVDLYRGMNGRPNPLVRRDAILVMARWDNHYFLSDALREFSSQSAWERRASIVSSYKLGDEGKHWRDQHRGQFSEFEQLVREWASDRAQDRGWEIPV